jgi:sarcosine oxidase subunit beta
MNMPHADVAIIGGGVIGCSIAYHLAQLDVDGVVFEKTSVAGGATGICPGGIRQQFENEAECRLAQRSMRFFEEANRLLEPENPFFLERSGYLFLAESQTLLSQLRRNVAMQNSIGVPSQIVDSADIGRLVPALVCDGIVGGSFCAEDGFLEDCDGFTRTLLRSARRNNFELKLQEVLGLAREGSAWRVSTTADSCLSSRVVIACGVDTVSLLRTLGIEVPIEVQRRRLAFTAPLPDPLMHPLVVALERSFAGKQLLNGVFYVGWLGETAHSDDLTFIETALTAGSTLLPVMAEVPVRRVIAGYYDSTPDHRPILGAIPGYDGLYLAAGFSGHGFMLAPAVGEMLANHVAGAEPDPLLSQFSLRRFQHPTFAEGMQI